MSSSSSTSSADMASCKPCRDFVIAGGSFAAISAVKILTKTIIPQARKKNPSFQAKITVIAPNTESYWNIASVRLVVQPELIKEKNNQIFFNLYDTLRTYFSEKDINQLNLIEGKVVAVDGYKNKITYQPLGKTAAAFTAQSISYDSLILATGASSSSAAFKLNSTTESTKNSLQATADEIEAASSICIIGAGAVGVELAGELGHKYGRTKNITLFSGIPGTLEYMKPRASSAAVKKLAHLGVKTVLDVRAICSYDEVIEIPNDNDLGEVNNSSLMNREFEAQSNTINTYEDRAYLNTPCKVSHLGDDEFLGLNENNSNDGAQCSQSTIFNRSQRNSLTSSNDSKPFSIQLKSSYTSHSLINIITGSKTSLFRHDTNTSQTTNAIKRAKTLTPSLPIKGAKKGADSKHQKRTIVEFDNGCKEAFDFLIPTTGNIPNTSFLPYNTLNDKGYVLTDPYLRMLNSNPNKNIYVFGDLVASGKQTLLDIANAQTKILQRTLFYDIIDQTTKPLKKYKPGLPTYFVPISKNGGVGVLYGIPLPSLVVSVLKGKSFLLEQSNKYLGEKQKAGAIRF
jgi:NADH dehydrogenase FAD-containing subunit